jgi:hypothetical protein
MARHRTRQSQPWLPRGGKVTNAPGSSRRDEDVPKVATDSLSCENSPRAFTLIESVIFMPAPIPCAQAAQPFVRCISRALGQAESPVRGPARAKYGRVSVSAAPAKDNPANSVTIGGPAAWEVCHWA